MIEMNRMEELIEKHGELVNQRRAAMILGVSARTIARMMEDGRLRRVGSRVDVRSICQYIANPNEVRYVGNGCQPVAEKPKIDFLAASMASRKCKKATWSL